MSVDLSLVPVQDLINEIKNRTVSLIVFGRTLEAKTAYIDWHGEYYECLGLCSEMEEFIKSQRRVDRSDPESNDHWIPSA